MKENEVIEEKNLYGGPEEFLGSPQEKAQKIYDIYNSIDSIKDKIDFIIRVDTYYQNIDDVPDVEMNVVDRIKNQFKDQYIIKGNEDTHREVYQAAGRIMSENAEQVVKSTNIYTSIFNDDEEELKQQKAHYLAENSSAGLKNGNMKGFIVLELNDAYRNTQSIRDKMWEDSGLNENSTMEDYARVCRIPDSEVQSFLDKCKAERNTNLYAFFREEHPAYAENIVYKIQEEILVQRAYQWQVQGHKFNLAQTEKTEDVKAAVDTEFYSIGKEGNKHPQFNAWINISGNAMGMEFRNQGFNDNKKDFIYNDINKYDFQENIKESSEKRIGGSTQKAYPWAFTDRYTDLSLKQQNEFNHDTNWNVTKKAENAHRSAARFLKLYSNRYSKVMDGNRSTSHFMLFTMWALGTQSDITVENMEHLDTRMDLMDRFAKFCEDYPTIGATTEQQYTASVKKWGEVILRATEKVKNYKMPEGDYSDPEVMNKYIRRNYLINHMCVDFMQDKNRIFENKDLGVNGNQVMEEHMGGRNWDETLSFWTKLQDTYAFFDTGYEKCPPLNQGSQFFGSAAPKIACNRDIAIDVFNRMAGKTITEGIEAAGIVCVFGMNTAIKMDCSSLDERTVLKSLNRKDKNGLKKQLGKILIKTYKESINSANETVSSNAKNFFNNLEYDALMNQVKSLQDTKQATLDFLNSKEKYNINESMKTPSGWISGKMNQLFGDNYRTALVDADIRKEEAFLINGKSPETLWGKKYQGLDENLKWKCYQVEIMKKIAEGNSDIKVRDVTYGMNGKAKPGRFLSVVKKVPEIQRLNGAFEVYKKGMKDITGELKKIKTQLLQTHPDAETLEKAEQEIGKVGTRLFQNMETTLNESIKTLEDEYTTPEEIRKSLLAYKKAADNYYKERYSRFGKRDDRGRIRLEQADNGRKAAPNLLKIYDDLRMGLKSDMICGDSHTFANGSEKEIELILRHYGDGLESVYHLNETKPSENEIDASYNNLKIMSTQKVTISNLISSKVESMGKDLTKITQNSKKTDEPYDAALTFYTDIFIEKMDAPDADQNTLQQLQTEIENQFRDGSFEKKVERLSKNSLFKELLKQGRGLNFKEWKKIETNTDKAVTAIQNNINETMTEYPDIAGYIMEGRNAANAANAGGVNAADPEAAARKMEESYKRLGELVSKQLLADPSNRVLVQAIEAGKLKFEDVQKNVIESLKKQKTLHGKNFNKERLAEKIRNGNLKKKVKESVLEKTKETVKRRPAPARISPKL
ncbi:hypothetical protein SAMN06297422_10110 [Lachnospiraceae bacterium]|nr:hypothetical protein SAMN06297422_10110 [Lachnospiraceae bacterium]